MGDTGRCAKNVTIKNVKNTETKTNQSLNPTESQGIGGTGTWKQSPETSLRAYLAYKYGEEKMRKNKDNRFDLDLEFGEIFETKLANILASKKIEVKTERDIWKTTGNIAIEIRCRGKLSGISATEAETWIHLLSWKNKIEGGYIFSTDYLKRKIKKLKEDGDIKIVMGGDDNMSQMVLIPRDKLFV